jgi:hypothetical protein
MGQSLDVDFVYGGLLDGGEYNDEFPWIEEDEYARDWIANKYGDINWFSMDRIHGISFVDYSWGEDYLPFIVGITASKADYLEDGLIFVDPEKMLISDEWNQKLDQFEAITGLRFKKRGWFACASFS